MEEKNTTKKEQIIISQFDGIFAPHEIFYLFSIKYSASRALGLLNEYEIIKEQKLHPDIVFSLIQEALNHSSAVSRYFWPVLPNRKLRPSEELRAYRGNKLRKHFNMEDNSILFNRELRNVFEHYDEYLDAYMIENIDSGGTFFPGSQIGDIDDFKETYIRLFRFLDINKSIVVLLGKKFEIKPIRIELARIIQLVDFFDINGGRLQKV